MSKDIPIIFSGPMVRALLEGRKTMTRRILKKVPTPPAMDNIHPNNIARHPAPYLDAYCSERKDEANPRGMSRNWCWWTRDDRQCLPTVNVRFAPGDRLWVRENWAPGDRLTHNDLGTAAIIARGFYQADGSTNSGEISRWTPSIHMPRDASRLTLIVTGVKVERLDSITKQDALAEGCKVIREHCYVFDGTAYDKGGLCHGSPVTAFSILWDDLHGDGAWEQNPFVVAISFRIIKANIDAPEARCAA